MHKRDQETFEILEKDCSFRDIKFLVCDACFYMLTGSSVIPEAEINAAKFKQLIDKKTQRNRDKAEYEKYLKYIKFMRQREEGFINMKEIVLPDLT